MQLHELKDKTCPTCGAATIREACTHRHANGQGFEQRDFGCGHIIRWSPNLQRQETVELCPHAPEVRDRDVKRKAAAAKLAKFLNSLDVDGTWLKSVRLTLDRWLS